MNANANVDRRARLRGGVWGPLLVVAFIVVVVGFLYGLYVYPSETRAYGHEIGYNRAMFGAGIEQPIPFSHRLHVTDKQIDCYYCHPYPERSVNSGLPSVRKCLACHNSIIPEHEEILKLKDYDRRGEPLPWKRVYYNPDHVYFPHFRHIAKELECQQCHGEVEQVDRLHQVTFYMGYCIDCHTEKKASRECVACHQ